MKLVNVRLVLGREIRDQLRDRRTLFMVFALPFLIYPAFGVGVLQMAQLMEEKPLRVLVVGAHQLTEPPPLFDNQRFADSLFANPEHAKLLDLTFMSDEPPPGGPVRSARERYAAAQEAVQNGTHQAAIVFPDDFARRLIEFRKNVRERLRHGNKLESASAAAESSLNLEVPRPEVIYNTAREKSLIAYGRVSDVLRRWSEAIGDANLAESGVPSIATRPFSLEVSDVADRTGWSGAAGWAKVLPVFLIFCALTGAFHPAVDLCAGEKERGTLETLLSSPAQRSEIVLGKLLTVMLFSMATAIVNVISIGMLSPLILRQVPNFGRPPLLGWVWLLVALPPVSALFSAICLAVAAFARSSKEGHYYLMPLMLILVPAVVFPVSSGMELTLGNALIPVVGLVLLLRALLEGNAVEVLPMVLPVAGVTLLCCFAAVRWAVDQFESETVLFREGERLGVGGWLRHLVRDRQPTPTTAAAMTCGVLILAVKFLLTLVSGDVSDFAAFAQSILVVQVLVIAGIPLVMTFVCTTSPRRTLLLRWPDLSTILAALGLAVAAHPVMMGLGEVLQRLYHPSESMTRQLQHYEQLMQQEPLWLLLLLLALTPAVFEELAFRGFILSGLRRSGRTGQAIFLSALLFGLAHGVWQQTLVALTLGLILAYVAIHSGSLLVTILLHLTYNSLTLAEVRISPELIERWPVLGTLFAPGKAGGFSYNTPTTIVALVAMLALLAWFSLRRYEKMPEEKLREAIADAEG
jgi:sodium transport system permease protein